MKKLISFLIGVLVIALVITCIVAFTTCDGRNVPNTNVETEDEGNNSQEEDISFYIRYNGQDVKNGAKLTFKEYDLNGIDVWGSGNYTVTVVINAAAIFECSINGEDITSENLNVDMKDYFTIIKTPTGYNVGAKQLNTLEYALSKEFAVNGEDAKVVINQESLFEVKEGIVTDIPKCLFKLTVRDNTTDKRLSIYFNLETASLELPIKVII